MKIEKNEKGRDFVVGDIHGMYDRFMYELDIIDFDTEKDRMFSVGDIIDRGPDSIDCLDLLYAPWFYAVLGNHEKLFVDGRTDNYMFAMHVQNGGGWITTLDKDDYIRYIELVERKMPYSMTLEYQDKMIGICHAEPPTNDWRDTELPLGRVKENQMIWGRNKIKNANRKRFQTPMWEEINTVKHVDYTIHGHTPKENIVKVANSYFIDTGACFGGKYHMTVIEICDLINTE